MWDLFCAASAWAFVGVGAAVRYVIQSGSEDGYRMHACMFVGRRTVCRRSVACMQAPREDVPKDGCLVPENASHMHASSALKQ